jgi:hypothetical protein
VILQHVDLPQHSPDMVARISESTTVMSHHAPLCCHCSSSCAAALACYWLPGSSVTFHIRHVLSLEPVMIESP